MPIILGVLASFFIGVSDTAGRASARRASAISHVSTQMLVGLAASLPAVFLIDSQWVWSDAISAALSGILIALGLSIVYRAMADSSSAIAAPMAGVLAALIPLAWDLLGGTSVTALTLVGCAIAIVSMAVVTFDPVLDGDTVRKGVAWAFVGGLFFGFSNSLAGNTSELSGAWPAVLNRGFGFLALVPLVTSSSVPMFLKPPVLRFGVLGGVAGALGIIAFVIGAQQGDLGTVAVLAATYPAVIVVLTAIFDDDHIRWWQAFGVAGAVAGTVLIALG